MRLQDSRLDCDYRTQVFELNQKCLINLKLCLYNENMIRIFRCYQVDRKQQMV